VTVTSSDLRNEVQRRSTSQAGLKVDDPAHERVERVIEFRIGDAVLCRNAATESRDTADGRQRRQTLIELAARERTVGRFADRDNPHVDMLGRWSGAKMVDVVAGLGELAGIERSGDDERIEPIEQHRGDADAHPCSRRSVDDEKPEPFLERRKDELDAFAVGNRHDANTRVREGGDLDKVRSARDLDARRCTPRGGELRQVTIDVAVGRIGADETDGRLGERGEPGRDLDRNSTLRRCQAGVGDPHAESETSGLRGHVESPSTSSLYAIRQNVDANTAVLARNSHEW
jgi:hypothetical protein